MFESELTLENTSQLINHIKRVSDPVRLKKFLFDFTRESPKQEELLLKVLNEEPKGLSEDHVDFINSVLMETIHSDQNLCCANTIKNFRLELKRNTKRFFDDLVRADFFPGLILTRRDKEIELPESLVKQIDPFDSPTLEEINLWFEELSLRMHLENGKPYNQLSLEKRGSNSFILKVLGPQENLTINSYTSDEIQRFIQVSSSDSRDDKYSSRYLEIGIKQISMITHGNQRSVETIRKLIANLSKFQHKNICISLFDDKESSELREKIRSLKITDGIELRYIGWDERFAKINCLVALLGNDKRLNIESAIGLNTGVGGNRNFVALYLGKHNYLTLDDDMEAGVETLIDNNIKIIDVDFLTIASRHIRPVSLIASDFRCSGNLDNAGISSIATFISNPQLSNPVNSWKRSYNSVGDSIWDSPREDKSRLIYDFRLSNVLSGGAASFPSEYKGLISRQATIVSTATTGRNEDVFLSVIPETILSIAGINPSIFSSAASAMQHKREFNLRNTNLVKNTFEEHVGQFIACIISFVAHESPKIRAAILSRPSPFTNLEGVFAELSSEIIKLCNLSEQEILEHLKKMKAPSFHFIRDIKDLLKMHYYKGVLDHPDPQAVSVIQAEILAQSRDAARKESYAKILSDLENSLREFFGQDYDILSGLSDAELDKLIFNKFVLSSHNGLLKYGLSLAVWSDMLEASDKY